MTSPGQQGKRRRRGLRRLWRWTVIAWAIVVVAPPIFSPVPLVLRGFPLADVILVGMPYTLRMAHGMAVLTVVVWVPALAVVGIRRLIRRDRDRP